MSYLVLARKYRPQTFDDVVDQAHITDTLINAISMDRVAHAILFTGPRGTGKTTVARILAKAMNCSDGPIPAPCNSCRSCREITSGGAVDVFEIDGASNNSVDQIRELRENVKYMPAHSSYKIYIIDEVHMLSTAAFNALLKTLEEPPAHVMFVFATTEPSKIPVTILSRCQRYDFRRIDTESISKHMAELCTHEDIALSEESLGLIAREAGGSMRDGLSLLDQVMACATGSIDYTRVLDILGVVDRKMIFDLSKAVLDGDISAFLDTLDEIYNRGHDMKALYSDLLEHFRNLLVVKMGSRVKKLVDLPGHEISTMQDQVRDIPLGYLTQIVDLLFKEDATIRYSTQPKMVLEMAFIRLSQVPPVLPIDELIEKLDRLRNGTDRIAVETHTGSAEKPVREQPAATAIEEDARSVSGDVVDGEPPFKAAAPSPASDGERETCDVWEKLLGAVSEKYPSLAANLSRCHLSRLTDRNMELKVKGNGFTVKMLRRNKNLVILKSVYHDLFGEDIDIHIEADADQQRDNANNSKDENHLKREALRNPRVADAIEIFDGKVIDVKLL